MAKRKKTKNKLNIISIIPLVLAVAVIALMLLDVVKFTGKLFGTERSFSGFNVIFGFTEKTELFGATIKTEVLSFSFVALFAVLLPLAGAFIQMPKSKILKLVGLVLTIGGAVLLFMMPSFVVFATDATAALYSAAEASLALGGIIAGIVAALQAVVIGYELLQK